MNDRIRNLLRHVLRQRYSLKGRNTWCLNWRNGWIRFDRVMIRWNTDWNTNYRYFSLEQIGVKS